MLREFRDQTLCLLLAQAVNVGDIHVAAMTHDDFLGHFNRRFLWFPFGAWLAFRYNSCRCLFKKLWHDGILSVRKTTFHAAWLAFTFALKAHPYGWCDQHLSFRLMTRSKDERQKKRCFPACRLCLERKGSEEDIPQISQGAEPACLWEQSDLLRPLTTEKQLMIANHCLLVKAIMGWKIRGKIGMYPIRRKKSHSRPTLEERSSLKGCFAVSGFVHSAT